MRMLVGIMFISACYADQASDPASTAAAGESGAGETHYCHAGMKLKERVRRKDGELGATNMTSTVDVRVVVSGGEASVELGAENSEGVYKCVRYRGIPLVDDYTPDITGVKGFTSRGFGIEVYEDSGWGGNPVVMGWAQTNAAGRRKFGADVLSVDVGHGLYASKAGESVYSGADACPTTSGDAGSAAKDCVEYLYQAGDDGEHSWEPAPTVVE